MTSIDEDLAAHVREWSGRVERFGESDCAQFIAAWVLKRTGKDVALRYGSASEAREILEAGGGLAKVLARQAARHGIKGSDYAERGDVGVVEFNDQACCGIRSGAHWIMYRGGKITIAPANACRIIAAWRL